MPESSLKKYDQLADRVRLHRQVSKAPILIVEGPSDQRMCARLIAPHKVDVFVAGTQKIVLDTARYLSDYGIRRVACLIDRDFDNSLDDIEVTLKTVVCYDNSDLESMLVNTNVLDYIINEFGSVEKIADFGGVSEVRRTMVELVLPLARIRNANAHNSWGLKFDAVDLRSKIQHRREPLVSMNINSVTDALISATPDTIVTRKTVTDSTKEPDLVCVHTGNKRFRGRDALSILSVLLTSRIGSMKAQEAHPEHLAKMFRLAVGKDDIMDTPWWNRLLNALGIALIDSGTE